MIKKTQLKIVLIFVLCISLNLSTQSQTRKYFIINGIILSDLNGSAMNSIQIIKNNQKAVVTQTPEHGRFRLELDYNAEYNLTFTQEGNQSKTVIINTVIPEKELNSASNLPHFLMAVNLFADNQDPGNLYSGNQIQHICYSTIENCFARVPTILDVEYVEKGNSQKSTKIQSQENKVKLQEYQVF